MKIDPIDIRAIRLELGFTQEDFAGKLNVSLSAVSKWEQRVSSPSRLAREKLEKLMKKEGSEPSLQGHERDLMAGRNGMMPTRSKSTIKS